MPWNTSLAMPADKKKWQAIETRYHIIHFRSQEDLKIFYKKIRFFPANWGIGCSLSTSKNSLISNKIGLKTDALFERVQRILGMQGQFKKCDILLCPGEKDLHEAFLRMGKNSGFAYGDASIPRAWYHHELNTIYINVEDLNEGILAHEMAHSIIDNYLFMRPPRPTAEILARYVDSHLFYE